MRLIDHDASSNDASSLWEQPVEEFHPRFIKRCWTKLTSIWADSRIAVALKAVIVRLALSEKITPETATRLIKRLGVKHA